MNNEEKVPGTEAEQDPKAVAAECQRLKAEIYDLLCSRNLATQAIAEREQRLAQLGAPPA